MTEPIAGGLEAALGAPFVLLAPGAVALALLPERDREALDLDEALFLSVGLSVSASSWVGLVLAELGTFSLATAAVVLSSLALAALLAGRRRIGRPWRGPVRWRALLPAIALLVASIALCARPSEYLVGGRDPGAYVAAMALIGRTGGIVHEDPAVLSIPPEDRELFYRHPDKAPFSWARFLGFDLESPESGRVYPQFFHLFPAFGAYLFQVAGVKGALATPPVFGVLGTLAVFFAARRLLGGPVALLGALLLLANPIQVWFARFPVSEMSTQFLVFLGLLGLAHWEERGSPFFGVVAGAALGLTLLVRIDSALVAVPLGGFLLLRRMQGVPWRPLLSIGTPFALLAAHATVHAALFARKYALDILNRPYWRQPLWVWLALAVLAALAIAGAARAGRWIRERGLVRPEALRLGVGGGVAALALYAYLLRPYLSAWAGGDGNVIEPLGEPWLGLLRELGFARLAAHDAQSLVRLGWFVCPLGLILGFLGLVAMLREWREAYLFPLLLALAFGGFYLYKIRVFNDYYFALRRYVPVVLPMLMLCAALVLIGLLRRSRLRRALAAACALWLLGSYARETARFYAHVDWKGSVGFVEDVARRFGPEDVVVFEQRASIHLISLPLWAAHGVNVLELARFDPAPARLDHLLRSWRERYRNVYFVYTYRTDLCSLFLQRVQEFSFGTEEWARGYDASDTPPRRPVAHSLQFTLARVVFPEELRVPPLPLLDVGGSDDALVSAGFHEKEGGGQRTYRWTTRCASVYLPGAAPGGELLLTLSAGPQRPASNPADVEVSFAGQRLGSFRVGPEFRPTRWLSRTRFRRRPRCCGWRFPTGDRSTRSRAETTAGTSGSWSTASRSG